MLACTHTQLTSRSLNLEYPLCFGLYKAVEKKAQLHLKADYFFFHVHRDDVRVLKKRCGTDVSLSRAYMTL